MFLFRSWHAGSSFILTLCPKRCEGIGKSCFRFLILIVLEKSFASVIHSTPTDLRKYLLDSGDCFLNIRAAVEGAQPEITFTGCSESAAWSPHEIRFTQQMIE